MVLLSGTPDFIAAPLAELVGATLDYRLRPLCHSARSFLAAPPLAHPYGPEKLRIAGNYASLITCPCTLWWPTPTTTATPVPQHVGHPVVVSADRVLRATAQSNGWEILD
ncbi:MAG: hypothetical protein R3F37_22215 [Candidatus Competibacteraceae bacterium]